MMGMDFAHKKFRQINFQKVSISANEMQLCYSLFQTVMTTQKYDFTKFFHTHHFVQD